MSYTIVWNENKTEGIILSGDKTDVSAHKAVTGEACQAYSSLAGEFYEVYGQYQDCTIQHNVEIK